MPYYMNPIYNGCYQAIANNDGYSITVYWSRAFPNTASNSVAYLIYYAENKDHVWAEGPKYITTSLITKIDIPFLRPGQIYHFGVHAVEYDPTITDLSSLPSASKDLYMMPISLLLRNIGANDLTIPLIDSVIFPTSGMLRVGGYLFGEIIRFNARTANSVTLPNVTYRGYLNSPQSFHNIDGYCSDGYQDPFVVLYVGTEEFNGHTYEAQCRFDIDHYAYNPRDGYKERRKDILTVDLATSDESNVGFQSYDFAGWHRTDPLTLLTGGNVGSYIGGEEYYADPSTGVGMVVRGLSLQEQNEQRQEILLSVTGEPIVLLNRQRTGVICSCYLPSSEYPDDRCLKCFGTGFVIGWKQYFNPRRADRRIMVRFGPVEDDLKMGDAGLESQSNFDCWSLTVPTIKDRDMIVRYDQNGIEEYRYEVLSVTRNRLLQSMMGGQKFKIQRVRKTDPIYHVRVFSNASPMPTNLRTSVAQVPGLLPHSHTVVVSKKCTHPGEINQVTGSSAGHEHMIVDGEVQEVLGHKHEIIFTKER
jgi:hypothetical protein